MAKTIMIQGTMSNAGKSLLAAGLCRVLWQDGYKVAPFKSQNMALNSFITKDGGEMGRAQVVQAEAAGIEPDVRMNPILLKPTTDAGSQVIIHGKVYGSMNAMEYYRRKKELIPAVMEAYHSLAEEYDIIVIEGAGSPAEINLKQDDIVNMGLAKMINAPVLLVGDIDRGGVFAQLYGTVALLEEEERRLIKGTIVNKFRGDIRILEPGIQILEDLCKVPVVGVMPYLHVDIDDEDSLTERFDRGDVSKLLDIAVIQLPRISNFTDFNAFERYDNVSLRYVRSVSELRKPDMIILPGTKSTIEDLRWMRQNGLEVAVKKAADAGTLIFGICGGYQMMGRHISDPQQVEAAGVTQIDGIGLLDLDTVFQGDKVQRQVQGTFSGITGMLQGLNGLSYEGYEIHMGRSQVTGAWKVQKMEANITAGCEVMDSETGDSRTGNNRMEESGIGNSETEGLSSISMKTEAVLCQEDHIYGSYIHGIFDGEGISETILQAICEKKGVSFDSLGAFDRKQYKERQYDLLADAVRSSLDMEKIYQILAEQG